MYRIGNEFYEKLYGSFGLTTFKDKHADIKGQLKFCFRGKKGVQHTVSLKSVNCRRSFRTAVIFPVKSCFNI